MDGFRVTIEPVVISLFTVWQTVMLILGAFHVVNAIWLVLLPMTIVGGIILLMYVWLLCLHISR